MNRIFVNEFRLLFDCCLSSLLIFCELFPAATAGSLAGRPTACCNRPNRIFELFLQTARRLLSVCAQCNANVKGTLKIPIPTLLI